jgi:hypothetical protein
MASRVRVAAALMCAVGIAGCGRTALNAAAVSGTTVAKPTPTATARPPALDGFAEVPYRNLGSADSRFTGSAILVRSAVDGHVLRTITTPGRSFKAATLTPSGRYVFAVTGDNVVLRYASAGGAPVVIPVPDDDLNETPTSNDADTALLWGGEGGRAVVTDDLGRHPQRITVPPPARYQGGVIGWVPDSSALYVLDSAPTSAVAPPVPPATVRLTLSRLVIGAAPQVLYTALSTVPTRDLSCGPAVRGAVLDSGTVVIVTDSCPAAAPTKLTYVDPASGTVFGEVTLPVEFNGATAGDTNPLPTADGGFALPLVTGDCETTLPVVLVHGKTVTRPSLDNQRCSTASS